MNTFDLLVICALDRTFKWTGWTGSPNRSERTESVQPLDPLLNRERMDFPIPIIAHIIF